MNGCVFSKLGLQSPLKFALQISMIFWASPWKETHSLRNVGFFERGCNRFCVEIIWNSDLSSILDHHCVISRHAWVPSCSLFQDSIELCLAHVNHCNRSQQLGEQGVPDGTCKNGFGRWFWLYGLPCFAWKIELIWVSGFLEFAIRVHVRFQFETFDIANIGYIGEYISQGRLIAQSAKEVQPEVVAASDISDILTLRCWTDPCGACGW